MTENDVALCGSLAAEAPVTEEMVKAALAVFDQNSWGGHMPEFTFLELEGLMPQALRAALRHR